jgi:hypothetical protein
MSAPEQVAGWAVQAVDAVNLDAARGMNLTEGGTSV